MDSLAAPKTQPLLLPSNEELKDSYALYRTRIADVFLTRILAFFGKLMDDVWTQCVHANELDKHLMQFQNALVGVSRWSRLALEKERDIIVASGDIDDLNVTISCLLVLQAKLLSFVCPGQQKHAITLDLPDDCMFVHHIYIACARLAWSNARLFHRRVDSLTHQQNHNELRRLLRECIHDTIDKYVPMKDIQRALLDKHEEARTEVVIAGGPPPAAPGGSGASPVGGGGGGGGSSASVAVVPAPPQQPLLSWAGGSGAPPVSATPTEEKSPYPLFEPPAPAAFDPPPPPPPTFTFATDQPSFSPPFPAFTFANNATDQPSFSPPFPAFDPPPSLSDIPPLDLSQISF